MEYAKIINIQENISRIGLGTWAIGGSLWGGSNEEQAIQAILKALEKGINFIDTAPAYGKGASEKIVGKALKKYGKRDKIVIATKFGLNQETDNVFRDSQRKSILKEFEDSLKRLQVDQIDLYQVHWPDPTTPLAETATALNELLNENRIKAIGVCNFSLEQMMEFKKYAPIHSTQNPYNLFEQDTKKLLEYCKREKIAVTGYSSLCRGLLSGKMDKGREFKGDDLRKDMDPKFKEPQFSEYLTCANTLKEWVEKKYHRSLLSLAIRWSLDSGIDIALWGARKPEQLNELESIFNWKLTENDLKEIDSILKKTIKHPVGTQFMEPPIRKEKALR